MSENLNKKTMIVGTGIDKMDEAMADLPGYETLSIIQYKKEVEEACGFFSPDILLIGENLSGKQPMTELLLSLKQDFPNMRIIYISTYVDIRDEKKLNNLGLLVLSGIYDILYEEKVTKRMILDLLNNPKTKDSESVKFLTKKLNNDTKNDKIINFEDDTTQESEEIESGIYHNMITFSSIKPGTGKSFLSTNVATGIAQFGVKNDRGERPQVAIIEADLQNLSVGTLLQIEENEKNNLKSVMDKISTIIDKNGDLIEDTFKINNVNEYILNSFTPYSQCKNLKALVGSKLTFQQVESFGEQYAYYYSYLLSVIADKFDVIIIDSNSALTHITTQPLLYQSKSIYYVLNLDFNNVKNNVRYKEELIQLGIFDRVKYILNEDVDENDYDGEKLMFTADNIDRKEFDLVAKVPEIPKSIFLNRLYAGIPVVLDGEKKTEKARYEILKVANQIWDIQDFDKFKSKMEESSIQEKKKSGGFFRFGKK